MGKKQILATLLVSITTFSAGFLLRPVWDAPAKDSIESERDTGQNYQDTNNSSPSQEQILSQNTVASSGEATQKENAIPADNIQVRIDDELVQWYDGTIWHTVASIKELVDKDKFYLALKPYQAFLQELQQEKVENLPQSGSDSTFMGGENLPLGKKETPKPTPKPATPPPVAEESTPQSPTVEENTPAVPSTPATPSDPTPPPSTPTPPSNPTPPPSTPTTPSNPTPPPSNPTPPPSDPTPPSSGDGEDISPDDAWSGLVL